MACDQGRPTPRAVRSAQLPAVYHRWQWRVLLVYGGCSVLPYMGRLHLSQVTALVMADLQLDHQTIGWMTTLLSWGCMAGDVVHGRLGELSRLRLRVTLGVIRTAPRARCLSGRRASVSGVVPCVCHPWRLWRSPSPDTPWPGRRRDSSMCTNTFTAGLHAVAVWGDDCLCLGVPGRGYACLWPAHAYCVVS